MSKAALAIALGVALTSVVLAPAVFAQHAPAAPGQGHDHGGAHGSAARGHQHGGVSGAAAELPHHVIVQLYARAFDENVAAGRGFGMAFVADQNGYPGPLHVLELKDRLQLTAEQEAKVQAMLAAMFAEAKPASARLLGSEAKLRRLFAAGHADEASVRAAAADVEQARTDTRFVHLRFHLKTREVLTDEQRRLYHEARWGEQGSMRLREGSSSEPRPARPTH